MPLMEGDIKVTNATTGIEPGVQGIANRTMIVEFTVRGLGPYTRVMPLETYNAEAMNELIREFARQIIATLELT